MSFDIQRVRGECNLSKTRIGDPDGGIAKVDPSADYYEWVDSTRRLAEVRARVVKSAAAQ